MPEGKIMAPTKMFYNIWHRSRWHHHSKPAQHRTRVSEGDGRTRALPVPGNEELCRKNRRAAELLRKGSRRQAFVGKSVWKGRFIDLDKRDAVPSGQSGGSAPSRSGTWPRRKSDWTLSAVESKPAVAFTISLSDEVFSDESVRTRFELFVRKWWTGVDVIKLFTVEIYRFSY